MQSYLKSNNLYKQCKTKIITLSLFAAHGCENVHCNNQFWRKKSEY